MISVKNIFDLNILKKMKIDSILNGDDTMLSILNFQERFLMSPDGELFIKKSLIELRKRKFEKISK